MSSVALVRRFLEVGRPQDALDALRDLDGDCAASLEAIELRGYAHHALKAFDAAADDARLGLQVEPGALGLLFLLSLAEEGRGDLAAAEAAILDALAQSSDDPQLLTQYASVLMRAGALEKAGRVLAAALASDPGSPDVLLARIDHAYLRHDTLEAERLTNDLLAYDPQSVQGHRMLGALAFDRGAIGSAAARLGEAVWLEPDDGRTAEGARLANRLQRPFYWPLRAFDRFGAAQTWVAAVVVLVGLRAAGLEAVAGPVAIVWITICVWSWIAAARLKQQLG
jgi:tetratricopeptide (TPR) repeat protein